MKNKEIEYLLNEMKDTTQDYVGTNGCKYQDLLREELNLLLSYIEQLQTTANERKQDYQRMKENCDSKVDVIATLSEEKKQLENNRDKAIEICDFYNKKYQKDPLGNQKVLFVISNIIDILKGDSDD